MKNGRGAGEISGSINEALVLPMTEPPEPLAACFWRNKDAYNTFDGRPLRGC